MSIISCSPFSLSGSRRCDDSGPPRSVMARIFSPSILAEHIVRFHERSGLAGSSIERLQVLSVTVCRGSDRRESEVCLVGKAAPAVVSHLRRRRKSPDLRSVGPENVLVTRLDRRVDRIEAPRARSRSFSVRREGQSTHNTRGEEIGEALPSRDFKQLQMFRLSPPSFHLIQEHRPSGETRKG